MIIIFLYKFILDEYKDYWGVLTVYLFLLDNIIKKDKS